MDKLENRHFVDTVFSIGKIHKITDSDEMAQTALFPFFNYLISDMLN